MKKTVLCILALMIVISGQSIAEEITLKDALQKTLSNNPELARFHWDTQALELQAISAGLRPNPELGLEVENLGSSNNVETTVKVSQLIEFGSKRDKLVSTAQHQQLINICEQQIVTTELLTETTKTFTNVLAARKQLELADELCKVAEKVLAEVIRRVEAGSTSIAEKHRAKVDYETTLIDRQKAQQKLRGAKTELSAKWNGTDSEFTVVGNLEELPGQPSLIIDNNPLLDKYSAQQEYRRAVVSMEKALSKPDITASTGAKRFHDTNETAFMVELEFPLQLFNKNRENSQAAEAMVRSSEKSLHSITIELQTKLELLQQELVATASEITALHDNVIPEAEKAFECSQKAWQRGAIPFTDVLYTERSLFQLKNRYNDALVNYHYIVIDIKHITGRVQS
ncbi:TolC family protein [bacterium]|nr:TolC family protein [bacterium]